MLHPRSTTAREGWEVIQASKQRWKSNSISIITMILLLFHLCLLAWMTSHPYLVIVEQGWTIINYLSFLFVLIHVLLKLSLHTSVSTMSSFLLVLDVMIFMIRIIRKLEMIDKRVWRSNVRKTCMRTNVKEAMWEKHLFIMYK